MQRTSFEQVVKEIVAKDNRYEPGAYRFIKEALDFTLKSLKRGSNGTQRHVTGPELLDGIRSYTLREFGPMSKMLLNEWGINSCGDFGQIVFNLVRHGVLGKSDSDRPEDFTETYNFDDAFVKPYQPLDLPVKPRGGKKKSSSRTRLKNGSDQSLPSTSPSE